MPTRIALYDNHDALLGHFVTPLDPPEVRETIAAEGADLSDWGGTFVPRDPQLWDTDESLILCKEGKRWHASVDCYGPLIAVPDDPQS
jgi:hypothetical protein